MSPAKTNVLFIVVDDLRPQLACYGRRQMVTPNIDALAGRGVLFQRAYCQVPVCGASRASVLSGVRPARDRFVDFKTWLDEDLPGALTLPEHFRRHGYRTHAYGKVFHHLEDTAERSWSEPPWMPPCEGTWRNYLLPESRKLDEAEDRRGPAYEKADVPDNAYRDGQIADRAISELERLGRGGEPFFLAVGFVKPHLPFNAPSKYWDLYACDDVPLAENPYRPQDAPDEAIHNWGELRQYFDVPRRGPVSEEMAHKLVHGYYAATSYTDAQVGRVLGRLDALGLRESTVVVLWGDHGWQLGEHSLWCKHCNFDTSLNAPLIVSAPGIAGGRSSQAIAEFLDIYPTLCDLASLPMPDHLEGDSLVPVLEDPARDVKAAAFSRFQAGDSIRTGRHLYTEWTDDAGSVTARMLYDHDHDAGENVNISEREGSREVVDDLSRRLRAGTRR
jgi:arylsulfatase A-like enzyme